MLELDMPEQEKYSRRMVLMRRPMRCVWQAVALGLVLFVTVAAPAGESWADPEFLSAADCDCCPDWQRYAIFDVLFLQRDNATNGAVIALQDVGGQLQPLFTTQSLQAATAPGVRLFYGELGPDDIGWEVGYVGVYGIFGSADRTGPDNLSVPGNLGQTVTGWSSADEIRPTYASSLNMAEFNLFTYCCETECPEETILWSHLNCGRSCVCTNWLFGLRWAGLDEQADLNVRCCDGDPFTAYSVRISSQFIGPQVGVRSRRQWDNWAIEGWAKAMLAGTILSSSADPITSSLAPGVIFRESRNLSRGGVGFIGDLNLSLVRRLTETWWLRAGYNLIWLSGAALAPDQWDFTDTPTSGTTLVGGGGLFLHGANLGIEARW